MSIAHHNLVLSDFSVGEIFQPRQLRLSPSEWARDIAELRRTPLPIIDVSGRPEMLRRTAVTVDIPGDTFNSEYRAWAAWFHMYRRSGQRWSAGKVFRQYTNDWPYREQSKAGEILSFSAAYWTLNVRSSRSGKHRWTLVKYLLQLACLLGQRQNSVQWVAYTSISPLPYGSMSFSTTSHRRAAVV
jgi:hypothetical protein